MASYEASVDPSKGGNVDDLLKTLQTASESVLEVSEDISVTDDLEILLNAQIKTRGLRWRLEALNKSLGSLRKGDFGFLFARPETGKTTFLADQGDYFASQDKENPVLWFNNEEQGGKVMVRVYQAHFGITLAELMSNPQKWRDIYRNDVQNGGIKIIDSSRMDINKRNVEAYLKDHPASCIIFDQIDKVKGFQSDREDLMLGEIYIWARELAKQFAPTIGVTQADGTAEGVKWLTMQHVANAKTSKQAEADWILGIGKTHDSNYENVRYLNISKNKLFGDEDSDPELRHGKMEVFIKPAIARYADI